VGLPPRELVNHVFLEISHLENATHFDVLKVLDYVKWCHYSPSRRFFYFR